MRNTSVSGGSGRSGGSAASGRGALSGGGALRGRPKQDRAGDASSRARTFGQTLRKTRRAGSVSQDDLARLSGVDRSAISNYERGMREPNLRTIVRLARALDVHPSALLLDL